MPKKTFRITNLTKGYIGSDHGSDYPNDSWVEGGNINVNRDPGVVALAGKFQSAQRPDDKNFDGTVEGFHAPLRAIGFPGRGLFYFPSDYSNLVPAGTAGTENTHRFYDHLVFADNTSSGAGNAYVGNSHDSSVDPGHKGAQIFIMGSRHGAGIVFNNPNGGEGTTASVLHMYQIASPPFTSIDFLGNNSGFSNDGLYNGYITDIPMGSSASRYDYMDQTDPNYSKDWFPVFYRALGGVRVCDGGFVPKNTAKLWIGYYKAPTPFSGITTDKNGGVLDVSKFADDNWIIDKGQDGLFHKPTTWLTRMSVGIFEGQLDAAGTNKVMLYWMKYVYDPDTHPGAPQAQEGESAPEYQEASSGLTLPLFQDGTIAVNIYARSGFVGNDGHHPNTVGVNSYGEANGEIILPKTGWSIWVSYVYENGEESELVDFGTLDDSTVEEEQGVDTIADQIYSTIGTPPQTTEKKLELIITWIINPALGKTSPRVTGAKLYVKTESNKNSYYKTAASSDYNLISEMSFEKGGRSPGSSSFNKWTHLGTSGLETHLACRTKATNFVETFVTAHGYSPEDIRPCYYKTAVVVNNRVYVGNVKFDGALYPDRMMKTQRGEYDTFTKQGFIDVDVDDGDDIVHLEVFADRILQFKRNVVHVINIAKEYEYLESSTKYAGINNPSQVVLTDKGIYWANRAGLWYYNGQNIINLLQNRTDIVANQSLKATDGVMEDSTSRWASIFEDTEDQGLVLSYDPIDKDVIIMPQQPQENNLLEEKELCFLTNTDSPIVEGETGTGTDNDKWLAYGTGTSIGYDSTNSNDKVLVTTSSDNVIQGMSLSIGENDSSLSIRSGATYRVRAQLNNVTTGSPAFATAPVVSFYLGGTSGTAVAIDNTPAPGDGIKANSEQIYQADITTADDESNLRIVVPASTDPGIFSVRNVEVIEVPNPKDDTAFIWNTDRNNLVQLFHRTTGSATKSNSITTRDGDVIFFQNRRFHWKPGFALGDDVGDGIENGQFLKVWNREASVDSTADLRNLYFMTKALDLGNHSIRKVIQSIHITYRSDGSNYLVPFIKAYYLDGTSPELYYLCTSAASGVAAADLDAANFDGILPDTSNKFETFRYRHVLSDKVSGSAVSLRSKIKNVGAIQVGLAKLSIAYPLNEFEIEELSITYREKSPK